MKKPSVSSETATRLAEDVLYTVVYEEIENGKIDKAAQARAIAEGGENEGAVRAAYIKHRIARMRAEIEVSAAQSEYENEQRQPNNKDDARDKFRKFVSEILLGTLIIVFVSLLASELYR